MKNKSRIILIGGATATSKSTESFKMMKKYKIVHKLGTGFIREMCKLFVKKKELPELYSHSFGTGSIKDPFKNLYKQSVPINKMINLALKRASREGTSMIIEGVNVIPGLTNFENSEKIIMAVRSEKFHKKMIFENKTHLRRKITLKDFKKIRKIQSNFIFLAKKHKWKVKYI